MKKSFVTAFPGTILFVIATLVGFNVLGKTVPKEDRVSAETAKDIIKAVGRLNGGEDDPCRFPASRTQ